nr:immunoglobulin light chain junction region [Macaca mulatta]
CQQGYTIPPTF